MSLVRIDPVLKVSCLRLPYPAPWLRVRARNKSCLFFASRHLTESAVLLKALLIRKGSPNTFTSVVRFQSENKNGTYLLPDRCPITVDIHSPKFQPLGKLSTWGGIRWLVPRRVMPFHYDEGTSTRCQLKHLLFCIIIISEREKLMGVRYYKNDLSHFLPLSVRIFRSYR